MGQRAVNLEKKIKSRKAIVGVIGLGYVGLPLVKAFLSKDFFVFGFDLDLRKVDMLNQGESYLIHVDAKDLKEHIAAQKFLATDDFSKLKDVDVVVICVPTPLDSHRNPDLSYVLNTTQTIAKYLHRGQLIVLESTTYPGTTEEEMLPILESTGLKAGDDFFLAYSPERENPGDKNFSTASIPKVVGGLTADCRRCAVAFYNQIVVRTVPVSSPKVAEASKLLENIFRSVNIALVNEMKMIFDRMGIDIWEVIKAASSKPFGFMPFSPGPGYGGHCIPVDPFYLTWKAKEVDYQTKFIELAGEINILMPYYVVGKTIDSLNERGKSIKGSKILVLGLSYKKDIDDSRESPALKIISLLQDKGIYVACNDPYVPLTMKYRDYPGLKLRSAKLTEKSLRSFDALIIVTDHSVYDFDWIVKHSNLVVDTRNAVKKKRKNVIKA
ncbi:MAG: nucleotide sugar dehydrogenase [Candidatus Aminicenantes bacterium]|nr:nucleotide sugar dehydrogenase [Candidatus Aminicenantes bacterium]